MHRVVLDASLEVRGAVVYATFVVAMVFLPVRSMSGVQGRLFGPLAVAYILAIMASLVVALTVTPALSALLLPKAAEQSEPPFITWMKRHYATLMERLMRRTVPVIVAAALLCVAAAAALPFFGSEFLPDLKEGHFIVHMSAVPGTSVNETLRLARALTAEFKKLPFVASTMDQIGRGEQADDTWGVNYDEVHVELEAAQKAMKPNPPRRSFAIR